MTSVKACVPKCQSKCPFTAMKARNTTVLNGWRSVKSKANQQLTEKGRHGKPLNEEELLTLIRREVRERKETNEHLAKDAPEYTDNLVVIQVLKAHLPADLSEEALEKAILQAIEQSGAKGPQDMGKAMQVLRGTPGVNMGKASQRVKALLPSWLEWIMSAR